MAAFVIQRPGAQQQTAQNPSQSFLLGVSDGSLLVLFFSWANTSGAVSQVIDSNNGVPWTQIDFQQPAGTLRTMYCFAIQNSGDGPCTVTISTDLSRTYTFSMYEVVGASINLDGSPIDNSSAVNGTNVPTGTLTTTIAGSIIFAAAKCGDIATQPSSPWTSENNGNYGSCFQVTTTPGVFSTTWTTASSTWATVIVAFQKQPGPNPNIGPLPIISDLPLSANELANPIVLESSVVGMVSYRTTWRACQPTQPATITNDPTDPSFNWSFLDLAQAQADFYNKLFSIHIASQGFGQPNWVKSQSTQFIDIAGDSVALYGNSYFQTAFIAFIQAMGTRYGSNPNLYKWGSCIASTGGSWSVPHKMNGNWITGADFTCPAYNASVAVTTTVSSGMNPNQYCFIPSFGWFYCVGTPTATQTTLFNPGTSGNASSGTVTNGTTVQVSDVANLQGPVYNYTTAGLVSAQEAVMAAAGTAFPNAYIFLQVGTSGSLDVWPGGPSKQYNAATQMAQWGYIHLARFAMDRDGFDPYNPLPQQALASADRSGWYLLAQPTTGSTNTSGTTGSIPKNGTVIGQANWPAVDPTGQYTPASTNNYKANGGVPYTNPIPVITGTLLSARAYFCQVIELYEQDLKVILPGLNVFGLGSMNVDYRLINAYRGIGF